jgi:hypothetical protein
MSNIDTISSQHQLVVRMFDADCKNMTRTPQHSIFHNRTGGPLPSKIQSDTNVRVVDEPVSTSLIQPNILFQCAMRLMPLLYVTVAFSGLTVLGILGSATGMARTLLSVALFNSALVPVLVLHCLMSIESKQAVGLGVCAVVYTSTSVPLSLIYNAHIFSSISFGLVIVFHCVAGGVGWRCIVHVMILSIFVFIGVWELPNQPDRGDTIRLLVLPGIRIMLVGVSGAVSTASHPYTHTSVLVV